MSETVDRLNLLPPNHTPFEEAFDLTGARIGEIPVMPTIGQGSVTA